VPNSRGHSLKSQIKRFCYLKEDAHAEAPEAGEAEAEDDIEEQEFHPGEEGSPHQLTGFTAQQNSNFNSYRHIQRTVAKFIDSLGS
jgi:hypothetical protein